jgi:hypothetical protein
MSFYVNKFDYTGEMAERGAKAEDEFVSLVKEKFKVVPATWNEQIKSHIDYYVYQNDKYFTVDVKARKKFTNEDKDVWIEFKNVNGGDGWIYGKSTIIAFERKDDFVLVNRNNLKILCERIVNLDEKSNKHDCLYKAYTRQGRKDVITKIQFEDIFRNMSYTKLKKK